MAQNISRICLLLAAAGTLAGQQFENVAASAGAGFRHHASKTSEKYLPETMGAGVALLDYDGDGLLDIYFVNGAELADPMDSGAVPEKTGSQFWNRLYRNQGARRFEDVTEGAGVQGRGYGMGAAVGDYDNDGDPDLFVTGFGSNTLYRNDGGGRFSDVTESAGLAGDGWSAGAAFFDFDRDGLLDLFVARYLDWDFSKNRPCGPRVPKSRSYCHPRLFSPAQHSLYRNRGDGRFEDISGRTGLADHPGKGLGVALGDYDGDGWTDVFVANDSYPQQLFRNVEGRKLEETALQTGAAHDSEGRDFAGMGVAWADYDGDGRGDLLVNALGRQGYWLYRNTGGEFDTASVSSRLAGFSALRSGWGMGLVDFDNDGWRDLFVAQGHVMDDIAETDPALDHREPPMLLRNLFGRFFDVADRAGPALAERYAARGAAFGDLDNDGLLDIVVSTNDGPALLLRNTTHQAGNSLRVKLIGTADNRDAIGARVTVTTKDGKSYTAFRSFAGSYLSASGDDLHFGLGDATCCSAIEVIWPGGQREEITPVSGPRVTIRQPEK
jgi:hypothetical protein